MGATSLRLSANGYLKHSDWAKRKGRIAPALRLQRATLPLRLLERLQRVVQPPGDRVRAAVAVERTVVLQGRPGEGERVGRARKADSVGSLRQVALGLVYEVLAFVDVDFLSSLGQDFVDLRVA